jgi:hypothetical protein
MGAWGDAIGAYMQPLIDQTDGSPEQVQKAMSLGTLCYNTALLAPDKREEMFAEFRSGLGMDDDEFDDFRRSVLEPMIARHEAMFPRLHESLRARLRPSSSTGDRPSWLEPRLVSSESGPAPGAKKSPIDRYAPCPCGSGKKFKFCCGAKGR